MSGVTFHLVETSMEQKCRAPGGKTISEAIADARRNVSLLSETSLALVEEGLSRISELVGLGDLPPAAADLAEIHTIADRLMGYSAAVDRPHLPDCLHALCDLTDAVRHSRTWLPATFTPMLMITTRAARGTLTRPEAKALLAGIGGCIERYRETPATNR